MNGGDVYQAYFAIDTDHPQSRTDDNKFILTTRMHSAVFAVFAVSVCHVGVAYCVASATLIIKIFIDWWNHHSTFHKEDQVMKFV